jgi:3-phenylpropionate/trans-cinnamate dioxygenase ferredoxin subunit
MSPSSTTTHVVARVADLPTGTARRFDIAGRSVAVVRIGDDVYAIGDTCSHGAVSLSEGEVLCDTKEIECWKHGSAFSLETGEPITLPATQPVPVYAAAVVDGDIVVTIEISATEATEATEAGEAAS